VAALAEERRELGRERAEARKRLAVAGEGGGDARAAKSVAGAAFDGRVLEGVSGKELKGLADQIQKQIGGGVVALVSVDGGKASIVVSVDKGLTERFDAVALVKAGGEKIGAKGGGGRVDMAQAGGPDGAKAADAIAAVEAAMAAA